MGVETIAVAAALGSGILGGAGALKEGSAAKAAGDSKAMALRAQADAEDDKAREETAVAQRSSLEQERQTDRLQAKQRAIAAASGGGTGGSAETIEGETAAEGKYQSELELWKGEEKKRGIEYQADLDRVAANEAERQGRQAKKNSYLTAASRVLGGMGSAYSVSSKGSGSASSGKYYNNNG